jgi:glycosyltransferase involved in cell wall biosynthesis
MTAPVLGMVLKGYPRISETFISNEILLLERLGLKIRIFSMRHPREPFFHESIREIQARVDYLPTELFLEFPRLLMPAAMLGVRQPGPFLAALKKAGQRFSRTRNLGTLKHLLQGAFIVNQYLRHSPEVTHLHAHFAHSPSSVAMFASMLSGLQFSFTAHAKDIYTSDPEQIREKINLASHVVTCTRYNKKYLQSLVNNTFTPVYCVYHGIDLRLFRAVPGRRKPRQPYRILTVARLTAKKGIDTVLKALTLLRDRDIDFEYTLIGDGEDRDTILEMMLTSGLRNHCRWLGTIPHDRVIREFQQADLFVLGCRVAPNGDRDGIPNVLVESLAMGLPAAGTSISALPEILRHEKTGLHTPPGNPEALAESMLRLLSDESLRENVISQGRELVRSDFDNWQLIKQLAAIYCRNIPAMHCAEK